MSRHEHASGRHDVNWLLDEIGMRLSYASDYVGRHRFNAVAMAWHGRHASGMIVGLVNDYVGRHRA